MSPATSFPPPRTSLVAASSHHAPPCRRTPPRSAPARGPPRLGPLLPHPPPAAHPSPLPDAQAAVSPALLIPRWTAAAQSSASAAAPNKTAPELETKSAQSTRPSSS